MARTFSANDASRNFGEVIDGVLRGEDYVITRYGKSRVVVVVDFLKYKQMEEALERALVAQADSDPEIVAAVERGLRDVREGRYVAEDMLDAYLQRKQRG